MNYVTIVGTIVDDYTEENEINIGKERIYKSFVKTKRDSGVYDIIPIICSENVDHIKGRVKITGKLSSFNKHYDNKTKLLLFVYVERINNTNEEDKNNVNLKGNICKKYNVRRTPLGRTIEDITIAVNTYPYHSDYIPCICWGRNAVYVSNVDIGSSIEITGRIQSREYRKILCEGYENRVAYELSVSTIKI